VKADRLLLLIAVGFLAACLWIVFGAGRIPISEWYPRDGWTYLAAGERLNAGHLLYSLYPGDRSVLLDPRISMAPLLSPPTIAVIWRVLAVFGEPAALAWWIVCSIALLSTLLILAWRAPAATGAATLLLALSIATEVSVGNVDALIVPGVVGLWLLARSGKWTVAASLAVALASIKVLPVFGLLWLFAIGPRRQLLIATCISALIVGLLTIAGAGIQAEFDYVGVLRSTAMQGHLPLSLSGLAVQAGLPFGSVTSIAGAVAAAAATLALRRRPASSFAAATIGMLVASTAVSLGTFVLLIPLLAPQAWPLEPTIAPDHGRPDASGGHPLPAD
jgi:Glycosyltransferase family 87